MHLRLVISLLLLAMAARTMPQTPVAPAERSRIISDISHAASQVATLSCDFTQTKTLSILTDRLVSHGNMLFSRPQKLRWCYTKPYAYTFIINGERISIAKDSRRSDIDLRSSQLFKETARLMAGSVTGQCLTQEGDFDVTILADATTYVASLRPKAKRLRTMFADIRLTFDRASKCVRQVVLTEPSGDTTLITFTNIRQNLSIDDKAFTLD
ncbi:MAG: outer membrane lipoprotein carrier protein LolA [Bacteroidaceae bacterium]|nr:outer membrane lipoprotein carrier protein LolA [Bacteroidaceae bacterium]